jgi:hypothetical protein
MSRPPNEKTPAGMNYSEGLPNQTESVIQTDPGPSLVPAIEARNLAKSVATCRARFAILGAVLRELPDDSFTVSAGGFTRHIQDLDGLHGLLNHIKGGSHE